MLAKALKRYDECKEDIKVSIFVYNFIQEPFLFIENTKSRKGNFKIRFVSINF